ncbi:epimerase [Microbacterium oleivorans]|uniref:DUF1731 domain-containing protein n=1 Tax=Microbacterium oleivorans TaxID=273677 RepID=A0A7D5JWS2_9MICO|nr:DUF1731 domain-containing protein [Microbacterium oleivorans]QLD10383.1 DUF1731 domain-containing protein [Microbacterium oleivorans]
MSDSRPRVVIAGASGFVGTALARAFAAEGYRITRIGRSADVVWGDRAGIEAVVDGAELIVNLAGKSVNCRYDDRNRHEILRSRVDTTRELADAVAHASRPPSLWLNASTATIYRHATDRPNTEAAGELGSGFSVDVARAWEEAFFAERLPETRRVALRMAIVIGDGPAIRMLLNVARAGLGGPQHDGPIPRHRRYRGIGPHPTADRPLWHRTRGRQRFSWVHIDDVVGAIRFIRDHDEIDGVVNVASPEPSDNRSLMRALRRIVRMPVGIPSWRWMLEPAMWLLRTEPELVLKSRWVLPERLVAGGYVFSHTDLDDALRAAASEVLRRRRARPRRSGRS